ncbi:NYN domain-containing protein [Pseudomonas sp. RIT-PI-S]|uniref:LabA-like NYN domain-containing protein n=1 Tax=Pseudomonas sp. RIT-PI-S TaxID=3035295 RepID=UPI0021DB3D2A|nr:NYN domain-containing protein [Pseudomonas sp. RIT-PI-S]
MTTTTSDPVALPSGGRRIALFADVQNLYYTVRQVHGCHFNYAALWAQLAKRGEIVVAFAYAIDRGDPKQQQFQRILRQLGFEVKLKPYIQRSDGSAKGDWDVGITIDVLEAAADVDEVVLASGDGDFDLLLQRIHQRHGVHTTVYGTPGLTAGSLIRAATSYVPIEGELLLRH